MLAYLGVIFALIALVCWGFGDFFIQKTARRIGSWKSLFFIGSVGLVGLFPLVKEEVFGLNQINFILLVVTGIVVLFAALFNFEGLRQGKIAIIEPITALELPITIGLSLALAHERITLNQSFLVLMIFIGIILAVTIRKHHLFYHQRIFEKGVIMAGIGAVGMGLVNFMIAISSQQVSPLAAIWFTHTIVAVVCGAYLIYSGQFGELWRDFKKYPGIIAGQSIFDNLAWITYGFAVLYLPISIVITIVESYVAMAVFLGIFVNHEKLRRHQALGAALAIIGVIALSALTAG